MSQRRIIYSCDLVTTGTCERRCQILEMAMIAWDLDLPCEPLGSMRRFHSYIIQDAVRGEPAALAMHSTILKRIAGRTEGYNYCQPVDLSTVVRNWVEDVQGLDSSGRADMTFAGKNFARLDSRFLSKLPGWSIDIKEAASSFNPGNLYFDPALDRELPDMRVCLERAAMRCTRRTGVDQGFGLLETKHDAMGNAELVIKLLRAAWDIEEDQVRSDHVD